MDPYPKEESRGVKGDPDSRIVTSGPCSLKRKNSETSDNDLNDSYTKKSVEDGTDIKDKIVRINENRTGKNDSNAGLRFDNLQIGLSNYDVEESCINNDEGFVSCLLDGDKSSDNSESTYTDTDQTQKKVFGST